MKALTFDLITPQGIVYSGTAEAVQAPGSIGSFEVRYNHAPMISLLEGGNVRVTADNGNEKYFRITGGVLEVLQNKVVILAEKAEATQS